MENEIENLCPNFPEKCGCCTEENVSNCPENLPMMEEKEEE